MKKIVIILFSVMSLLTNFKTKAGLLLPHSRTSYLSDTTITEKVIKTKDYEAKITCISLAGIETYMDSGYFPRSLYYNIRFTEVLAVTQAEVAGCKLVVKVFNEKNKVIPLPKESRLYAAKTFKEGSQINILISIPLNPADTNNKKYSYTFSLETSTGKKFIEMTGKLSTK